MHDHLEVCILAAGLGKRMKSTKPKVLHTIAGQPMLAHLLSAVESLAPRRIHVVVGRGADEVKAAFADRDINFVLQKTQEGTGHAVMQVMPHVERGARLLMLLGDAPLITKTTLERLAESDAALAVLTVSLDDPTGYGRIIRGEDGNVVAIVEERDATGQQRSIDEINTGVMVADTDNLGRWLDGLDNDNDQGEYLLTDIVGAAVAEARPVVAVKTRDADEVRGVNNLAQLAALEREFQRRQATALMEDSGVHLLDPARFDLRGTLEAGPGCIIDVNCVFEGECRLGEGVTVGPNCVITNAVIGDRCHIAAGSVIDGASVAEDCIIGPFARLRPGTRLASGVAIGNFVEVKNSEIGENTKANHLSYLGDATIGSEVNIGAGTITCNYDGVAKHRTKIGDGVFVGSNTALVAPVTLGERSLIGAGSTITKPAPANSLVVARGKQVVKENWNKRGKS